MKNLEIKSIEQLLSIIPEHPAIRIMQISDSGDQFSNHIQELVQQRDYEFLLNITNDVFYEEIKDKYNEKACCQIKQMKFEQRRYANMAKMYDYIFVTSSVPDERLEIFTKTIHGHIKNAGNIILFLPKNDLKTLDSWQNSLVENYFVASNTIDMFEHYEILISKKMHGWGG